MVGGVGGTGCWWFGGRGWTVTFRTSLANRKDKEKRGGKAIVPRKSSPGQACDLPGFLQWLVFGAAGDARIRLSVPCPMNYSVAQRSV